MTIEEAQEKILELTEQLEQEKAKVTTLENDKQSLSEEVERVRTVNQRYFEKLTAQVLQDEPDADEPDDVPSMEEFAKTLNI